MTLLDLITLSEPPLSFSTTTAIHDFSETVQTNEALFHSLPNNKILDWSKLKAFADDKICVTERLKFVLERVENIVGEGENAGH